jgi:Spy/CpxP family protein refolding chaperone
MKRLLLVLLCACAIAPAQDDPVADHFVPPEQIMRHQSELGITAAQREQIKQQVRNAQMRFTELQWDLQADMEALSKLLEDRNVSEAAVIEQLDSVLAAEADIKRTQVSMLIALRKVLTEEQLEEARALTHRGYPARRQMRELERQMARAEREMASAVKQKVKAVLEKKFGKERATPAPSPAPVPPAPPAAPRN